MREFLARFFRACTESFLGAAYDLLTTFRVSRIHAVSVLTASIYFAYRVLIVRPLLIFCCTLLALLTAIPIAVFFSPIFTGPVLYDGAIRVIKLVPHLWRLLFFTGLLFEVHSLLRHLGRGIESR
ncbi:hypothetical protein J1782_08295 [Rahnella sp. BCC 1045]|uniref:hypothetical protein n=1 Tax=Rahnella sp. BCC 1045 TaxID=2816251 RepID=UPI001C264E74|nr:hypothetical protein [Rahnella sp. BCC 1045]MBU9819885.1 hypothetical protein [Rahnella sp. BCC 1045]